MRGATGWLHLCRGVEQFWRSQPCLAGAQLGSWLPPSSAPGAVGRCCLESAALLLDRLGHTDERVHAESRVAKPASPVVSTWLSIVLMLQAVLVHLSAALLLRSCRGRRGSPPSAQSPVKQSLPALLSLCDSAWCCCCRRCWCA